MTVRIELQPNHSSTFSQFAVPCVKTNTTCRPQIMSCLILTIQCLLLRPGILLGAVIKIATSRRMTNSLQVEDQVYHILETRVMLVASRWRPCKICRSQYTIMKNAPTTRLYSVMVSTSDSDSGNPSSIPGTTSSLFFVALFCASCLHHHSSFLLTRTYFSFFCSSRFLTRVTPFYVFHQIRFEAHQDIHVAGTLGSPACDSRNVNLKTSIQPTLLPVNPKFLFHVSLAVWIVRKLLRPGIITEELLVLPM